MRIIYNRIHTYFNPRRAVARRQHAVPGVEWVGGGGKIYYLQDFLFVANVYI